MTAEWKFLDLNDGKIVSRHGNQVWDRKWKHQSGNIVLCVNGFHSSPTIRSAFSYVQGQVLAKVEVRGESAGSADKTAWRRMRITKAYKWSQEDSVALAVYAAELVLGIFESRFPEDNRPRKAIEAARALQKDSSAAYVAADTAVNAARAAGAASDVAAGAAYVAADAAYVAAGAARATARAAARAAAGTARAAARVARAAARVADADFQEKIETWFQNRLQTLEEI